MIPVRIERRTATVASQRGNFAGGRPQDRFRVSADRDPAFDVRDFDAPLAFRVEPENRVLDRVPRNVAELRASRIEPADLRRAEGDRTRRAGPEDDFQIRLSEAGVR